MGVLRNGELPVTRFDVTTFGEVMLRLSVPSGLRLADATELDLQVGGAELNVCAALASLGRSCSWLSGLPEQELGEQVIRRARAAGIDTSGVIRQMGRMGLYFVEFAASPRAINVIYDRQGSVVTSLRPADLNWDLLLNTRVLHLTGITAALSPGCQDICNTAVRKAKAYGVTVSFDVNYRSKLWSVQQAASVLLPLLKEVDILICGRADAIQLFGLSGTDQDILSGLSALSPAEHIILTQGSDGALMRLEDELLQVSGLSVDVVDRLGAGDAFTAGVIDAYLDGDIQAGLQRGVALSAMALTQNGDMLLTTRQELDGLLAGQSAIRR